MGLVQVQVYCPGCSRYLSIAENVTTFAQAHWKRTGHAISLRDDHQDPAAYHGTSAPPVQA